MKRSSNRNIAAAEALPGGETMKRYLWALAALIAPVPAWAADDPQEWTTLAATVKLDDHWRLQEELVFRFSDARQGLYEIESNTLVGYRIGDTKITVWAGYTHDPQYFGGDFTVMEHRARQQVTVDDLAKFLGGSLSARMRVEERWRDGVDGTGYRLRPYVKFTRPFHKGSRTALVLSHESFVDLNTNSFQKVSGEDRMRNLLAISTKLDKHTTAEFGYLNQHFFVPNGPDNNDHVASIALSFSY